MVSKDMKVEGGMKEKDNIFIGKGRYKVWALAVIILLAFWSMLSGTASLKWSAGNLSLFRDELDIHIRDDFDVLEIEAREKVVRHMWDVYVHYPRLKLTRFWQEAFHAAYEELESEVPGVREHAITEIAKMSLRSLDLDSDMQKLKRDSGRQDKSTLRKRAVQRKIK
eukprot:TRINITY_DN492_c0_g1_i2.p1 TRINITY_DN492_c0_g1~~TRINITY_DN492_c0_g1_i2.p1  ORF type:complete len:167 (+),score=28.96 TRINITY_DN492_c0_g1_i2:544-1044(+)